MDGPTQQTMKKEDRFIQWLVAAMFVFLGFATLYSLDIFNIFKAEGASLAQQLDENGNGGSGQALIQTFTPVTSGFAKFVYLRAQLNASGVATTSVSIFDLSDPSSGLSNLVETSTTTNAFAGNNGDTVTATSTLAGTTYLQAGRTYTLWASDPATDVLIQYKTTSLDTYNSGQGYYRISQSQYGSLFDLNGQRDWRFDITDANGASLLSNAGTPQLLFPTNNINTADFDNWVGRVTSSSISGTFFVRYSQSTSTWQYSDPVVYASSTGTASFNVPKRRSLWDYNATSTMVWYAQVAIQNADGTSYGAIVQFNVTGPDDSDNAPPNSFTFEGPNCDSSTTAASSTLQEIGCELRAAGFALMKFFVVPGQSSTAFLISSYEDFQEVFPFSIFFSLTDLAYEETSSTSTAGSVTIPWPSEIGGGSVVVFGTSTALKTITSNAFASTLFNAILLIAVFAFGYAIFKIIF